MVESLKGYIKSFINDKDNSKEYLCDLDFMGDIDEDKH